MAKQFDAFGKADLITFVTSCSALMSTIWNLHTICGNRGGGGDSSGDQIPLPLDTNDSTMFHLSQILITFLLATSLFGIVTQNGKSFLAQDDTILTKVNKTKVLRIVSF